MCDAVALIGAFILGAIFLWLFPDLLEWVYREH